MAQKTATGEAADKISSKHTESLIREELSSISTRRITKRPDLLDDEKLPESDRITVLNEIFNRNIRSEQLKRLARHLSPVLGTSAPSDLLIYGPSGTGKSVTCLHFLSTLAKMCAHQDVPFRYAYVDLTTPHSCFAALNELAIALDATVPRYRKGIALEHMQEKIISALACAKGYVCVLVDEVDNITVDSNVFYTFLAKTLPRKVNPRLIYVFLTNRLEWERTIDPRVLSVLKKTDLIFEPYNAEDLLEILKLRVEKALHADKVDAAALGKIAALASRETGDARKAVELLATAVKVAEEGSGYVGVAEVDEAEKVLELDKSEKMIRALAPQQKLVLIACYLGLARQERNPSTGQVYQLYKNLCDRHMGRPLAQRSFTEVISFLDIYGLINAPVISKGRYGMTREFRSALPGRVVDKLLDGSLF